MYTERQEGIFQCMLEVLTINGVVNRIRPCEMLEALEDSYMIIAKVSADNEGDYLGGYAKRTLKHIDDIIRKAKGE